MSGRFAQVPCGAPVEVFALTKAYNEDPFPKKVNLGVGAYRTEKGQPWVLPVVRKAERALAADETLNKEYLPITGLESFSSAASKMLLGESSLPVKEKRIVSVHSLSGTGSLRVGAEFLQRILGYHVVYNSAPTWGNHSLLFRNAGFADERQYRYWSGAKRGLDLEGMLEDLRNAPENAVILLHGCAHNPTGCDPTEDEWRQIADVMEARKLFPFFDCAYQGFASGDLERDAWSVRYFVERGFEMLIAQSFAKNFGLYGERVGNLTFVLASEAAVANVRSQVSLIVRGMYSNPPSHGARIVDYVLRDAALYAEWQDNIKTMSSRIKNVRKWLRDALERINTPGDWSHITAQIGMFSYTGLNAAQSDHLVKKYHIYLLRSGRISMCGLNADNIEYVATAIKETLQDVQ